MRQKLDPSLIPSRVTRVASALRESSGRAFLVGGPVRDLLLGKEPVDWDIATDLPPDKVLEVFPGATKVGIEFGRMQVDGVDVVSLRAESGYRDRRHPSRVVFGVSIEEDLRRRDFTINAMAAEFDGLVIIDPFGGREDLERRIIRAIGEPSERFSEDPLRTLRAIRFEAALDMDLHPSVAAALPEAGILLRQVSGERVFAELSRILVSPRVQRGMKDMAAFGLAPVVLPEVFAGNRPGAHLADRLGRALSLSAPDLVTRMALVFAVGMGYLGSGGKGSGCSLEEVLRAAQAAFRRFNVAGPIRRDAAWVLRNVGDQGFAGRALAAGEDDYGYLARRLLDEAGREQVERLLDVERAAWAAAGKSGLPPAAAAVASGLEGETEESHFPVTLALTGDDVVRILGDRGRAVGEALEYLKEIVLRDPRRNEPSSLERALRERWRPR